MPGTCLGWAVCNLNCHALFTATDVPQTTAIPTVVTDSTGSTSPNSSKTENNAHIIPGTTVQCIANISSCMLLFRKLQGER